jgi:hypothetical protein
MKLVVEVWDTKWEKSSTYLTDWEGEFDDFIWSEGNYSCDCNRSLFFQRGMGIDEMTILQDKNNDFYLDCNFGPNRFKVTVRDEAGKVLYTDRS